MNKKMFCILLALSLGITSTVLGLTHKIYNHNFTYTTPNPHPPFKQPIWVTSSSKAYAVSDWFTWGHARATSVDFWIAGSLYYSVYVAKDQSSQSYASMSIQIQQFDGSGQQVYSMVWLNHGVCSGLIDSEAKVLRITIQYNFVFQTSGHGGHKLPLTLNYWG